MSTFRRPAIAFTCGVLLVATSASMAVSAEQAATWSFGAGDHATCPKTITRDKETIVVDLSALPEGAEVFRAVLRCRRQTLPGWQYETDRVVVAPAAEPERPLRLLPPRYASLDATASVAACVKEGKETLELVVKILRPANSTRSANSFESTRTKPPSWEAPPRCNLPSRPYDYLVILGPDMAEPAPLNLVLHCWGSNFRGKGGAYSWFAWKDRRIGIGVASNQIPYDWWTCYHENRETWKPWTDGVSRAFTAKRLLAFVDYVASKWDVDRDRVCVSGESMGGAGSAFMGLRYPERFAYLFSAVGVHDPAAIKGSGFHESYARVCGRMESQIKHESGALTFDYSSDPLWVRKHPAADLPFVGFGNGKNDHGIGWSHAVDLVRAFQETRQPHAMIWNLRGHGAGTFHAEDLDICRNRSLPAFTKRSLDGDIGTATKRDKPEPFKHPWGEVVKDVYDGDPEGQINSYLRWRTDGMLDRRDQWAAVLYLAEQTPEGQCTVHVTPRRVQQLQVKPGRKFRWTNTPVTDGRPMQSGEVVADGLGLLTVEKVVVTKTGNRLELVAVE